MRSRIVFFSLALALFVVPKAADAEYIRTFDSTIDIKEDSSFIVTEAIEYVFTSPRHGIFRYIPTEHPQEPKEWYKDRYLEIELLGVTMDGENVPYEVEDESDQLYVRIGDPDVEISGTHMYVLTYEVRGGISYLENGGAEIYWDATGFDWEVPIESARVTVNALPGMFRQERACYRGTVGASGSCNLVETGDNAVIFSANALRPEEGITIAQALNENGLQKVVLERVRTLWFWIPALLIWFLVLTLFVYRYKTAYRTGNTIIPEYEPYGDFKPMYTGLLFDGTLNPEDITASIVYMAEQGYLKIKKVERKVMFFFEVDDYEITLVNDSLEKLSRFQREVLKLLFGESLTAGSTVTLSTLRNNQTKQKQNYKVLQKLKKDLEQDLEDSGFFQVHIPTAYIAGAGAIGLVLLFFAFEFLASFSMNAVIIGATLVLSLGIILFMYRRRTRKGYEALDHLEGFKLFLSVTEKERYEFHNAPEKSPEQFMEYLPYAIAFGVEERWAEVFKDITIPDPTWYEGASAGHFSATNLTTSLGAFSTAFAASSGSSGSSGGGSAGGGGGGGGGGSW